MRRTVITNYTLPNIEKCETGGHEPGAAIDNHNCLTLEHLTEDDQHKLVTNK